MDAGWLYALRKWLNPQQDSGGAWAPDPMAVREAQAAYAEAERAKGQMELLVEEIGGWRVSASLQKEEK